MEVSNKTSNDRNFKMCGFSRNFSLSYPHCHKNDTFMLYNIDTNRELIKDITKCFILELRVLTSYQRAEHMSGSRMEL